MRTLTILAILATGCGAMEPPADVADHDDADGETAVPRQIVIAPSLAGLVLRPAIYPEDGGAYAYTVSMPAGTNLWRVPLAPNLADSACADLSDPVFYVRAAPANSAHRNDWVVFIPGGGAAQGIDQAVSAWFGEDESASYGQMSSRWAPPSIGPGGILDPTNPDNPFTGFNMVFIHKCSFDRFMGRRAAHAETLLADHRVDGYLANGSPVGTLFPLNTSILLAARGHDIVDAVFDTLATTSVRYNAGAGNITMPSLAQARSVLFIGHSGGSRGATMIIDDVAAHIRSHSAGADVKYVMDAGFFPGAESLVNGAAYPATSYPTNDPGNGGNPLATVTAQKTGFDTAWQADLDATCLANEANPAVCGDVLHVVMNWVETPLYIRQDLADVKHTTGINSAGDEVDDCWQTDWDTDPDICYGNTLQHGGAVLDQVADLNLLRTSALSHTVLGTTLARPSGFFPACGFHNGAQTDDGFYSTLITANGLITSYASGLWTWFQFPNLPIRAIEATPPVGIPIGCDF